MKKKDFVFVRELIKEILQRTNQVQFRDYVELQQATKWLHENGKDIQKNYLHK
jgi:hypothetical protein